MPNISFFYIALENLNLFSFMMGMLVSSLLGWRSAWKSLIFVVIYLALVATFFAFMYHFKINL